MSSIDNQLANSQAAADLLSSVSNIPPTPVIIPESSSNSFSNIIPNSLSIPGSIPSSQSSGLPTPLGIPGSNPNSQSSGLPTLPFIPFVSNPNSQSSGLPTPLSIGNWDMFRATKGYWRRRLIEYVSFWS
jgi:hypothetical protein